MTAVQSIHDKNLTIKKFRLPIVVKSATVVQQLEISCRETQAAMLGGRRQQSSHDAQS